MLNRVFKKTALPIALTTAMMTAAIPAFAGKDFIKQDLRNEESKIVQLVGERLSEDKLVFVVHGGNRNLMMAAYRVAQQLDDENVPVALLLAPDRDSIDITMHVDFYTKGGTRYYVTAFDNENIPISETEADLYGQAKKAYEEDFGSLAKKSPSEPELPTVALR